jgi:hypothetical protein
VVMQALHETIKKCEEMQGIPHDVRTKATEVLWQGINEALVVYKTKLVRAQSTSMHSALVDVCRRGIQRHQSRDAHGCLLNAGGQNFWLENPLLFDQFMESSIADNNLNDVMHLMHLKLSQMRV